MTFLQFHHSADKENMKGCRPLSDSEAQAVLAQLTTARDRALFVLGERTGFRISELLSLRLSNVFQNGHFTNEITVSRRHMKKKREGRTMFLHENAQVAIKELVEELRAQGKENPEILLFQSRQGENRAINRQSAWIILRKAFAACGLTGKLATHTMRKTFARRMKELSGNDLGVLQKLLGHAQITSTMSYVEVDESKLRAMVLKK